MFVFDKYNNEEKFDSLSVVPYKVQRLMIKEAIEKHESICTIIGKKSFSECFILYPNKRLTFWFNTFDHSTHTISIKNFNIADN